MFKRVKDEEKSKRRSGIFWSIFLGAFCILYLVFFGKVVIGKAISFEEAANDGTLKRDQYAYVDVKCVLEDYATTQHTINFIPSGTDEHFLIVLENGDILPVKVSNKKTRVALSEIRRVSFKDGQCKTETEITPVRIKGMVFSIDPDIERSMEKAVERRELFDNDRTVYYCELDCTWGPGKAGGVLVVLLLVEAVLVYSTIDDIRKKKRGN